MVPFQNLGKLSSVCVLEQSACVCTVWVQLRLRWGSLVVVVELAGGGRGPRLRVPPGHHLGVPPVPRPLVNVQYLIK